MARVGHGGSDPCAEGCTCGRHSAAASAAKSAALKGRPKTPEHRAKIAAAAQRQRGFGWRGGKYWFAHQQILRLRGPARDHSCGWCGKQALDWVYLGGAPDEQQRDERGGPYSLLPIFYVAGCRSCHRLYDFARQRPA